MHQFPVSERPSEESVKKVPPGHEAKVACPSRERSTRVGVPVVKPTVTFVYVPLYGRFGAPSTESVIAGVMVWVKDAATVRACVIETGQVVWVPVQAPLQPAKVVPD